MVDKGCQEESQVTQIDRELLQLEEMRSLICQRIRGIKQTLLGTVVLTVKEKLADCGDGWLNEVEYKLRLINEDLKYLNASSIDDLDKATIRKEIGKTVNRY